MMRTFVVVLALLVCTHSVCAQKLEAFAEGFDRPLEMVADPTDDGRFYVVEQGGLVKVVQDGKVLDEPFFEVDRSDFTDRGNEQGLLGMCLDPDWATNRRFYINHSGRDGATRVMRYTADNPTKARRETGEELLRVDQPYANHNAGCLRFGPDGYLYIPLGDGGAANDPHGNGQNKGTLRGSMLRIDVTGEPDEGLKYAIPSDNPFVGEDGARAEIWAIGLRNVWKFSFDKAGNMWMGDVGQNRFEEVDFQPASSKGGENYGWNQMEGRAPFRKGNQRPDPRPLMPAQHAERGLTAPVWVFRRDPIGSVTGGYVYEGEAIDSLRGRYVFGDYVLRRLWSFRLDDGRAVDIREHTDAVVRPVEEKTGKDLFISSFGRDNAGELYVLSHREGVVYKLVP